MKKFVSLLLALTLSFCTICSSVSTDGIFDLFKINANAATVNDLIFDLNDDGKSYAVKINTNAVGEVVIPSEYNGMPVTKVGACYNCLGITSVYIPDSVTTISPRAFYYCKSLTTVVLSENITVIDCNVFEECTALTDIRIPDNVTSIGSSAFAGCANLETIIVPDTLTSIGSSAFSGCKSLVEFSIPDGITSIESCTFENCTKLSSVTIHSKVSEIGSYAFSGCIGIEEITIPTGVTKIGYRAFYNCENINRVTVLDLAKWCEIDFYDYASNPLYYGRSIYYNGSVIEDLIIPDGVESIGAYAFYNCDSIASLYIPDTVVSIGESAFNSCSNLASTTISDNVITIGDNAFSDCSLLIITANCYSCAGKYVRNNNIEGDLQHEFSTEWTIDTEPTCIALGLKSRHCEYCEEKTDLTDIPSSEHTYNVTSVLVEHPHTITQTCSVCGNTITETQTISGCFGCDFTLTEIDISSYKVVSYVGNNKNIVIPGTYNNCAVTTISKGCFENNSIIEKVEIGDGVTTIDSNAFMNCASLKEIYIPATVSSIGDNAFYGFTGTIYCHNGSYAHDYVVTNNIECIVIFISPTEKTTIDYKNLIIFSNVYSCSDLSEIIEKDDGVTTSVIPSFMLDNSGVYGTGTTISIFDDTDYVDDYTVITIGDLNGDGVCNVLDVFETERASNSHFEPSTEQIYAANGYISYEITSASYQNVVNIALKA